VIAYADLNTLLLVILLVVGLAGLTFGGDWLCRGAASLALNFNINRVVVGLTIVSIATSMPELVAALVAAASGNSGIAMGNIIGSNIGNIGLILGVSAIIYPMGVQARLVTKEVPILLGVTVFFVLLLLLCVLDGARLGRIEGFLLLVLCVGYLWFVIKQASRKEVLGDIEEEISEELAHPISSNWLCFGLVALGTTLLALGADLLVGSASELAHRQNISNELIGLTVVAIGTSLPELAASVAAARRKQADLIAGNIVGSNLFNMVLIGGTTASIFPIKVDPTLFQVELPALLLFTFLLWIVFLTNRRVTRMEGAFLLILYFLILGLAFITEKLPPGAL